MGAKMSLQDIKNNDIEILLKKIKVHELYRTTQVELRETNFDIRSIYSGMISQEFASVVSDKLIKYVNNNFSVLTQTMLFAMVFIRELSYTGLGNQAKKVAEELSKHKLFRDNLWYLENSLKHITDDVLFYIIAHPYYYSIRRNVGTKYNYVGLNQCETTDAISFYTDSLTPLFNDKYLKQFKISFCYKKVPPLDFIINHTLDHTNTECLLWILNNFKFTSEQAKIIFKPAYNCKNNSECNIILAFSNLIGHDKDEFYRQVFWSCPKWRSNLVKYQVVSKAELEMETDGDSTKENILLFEFTFH
jgi:hypothetical protein